MRSQLDTSPVRSAGGFFTFHGPWAPGVRLFRRLAFPFKAVLVSVGFLLPLSLLLLAYLNTVQTDLVAARQERAGLQLLAKIEPWLAAVQRERGRVAAESGRRPDMAEIEATLAPVRDIVAAAPEGVDVSAAFSRALKVQAVLTAAAPDARQDTLSSSLQADVDVVRALRNDVLDASQLSLDPEQATYYLMLAATTLASDAQESVLRARGEAAAMGAVSDASHGRLELHDEWHDGRKSLDALKDAIGRADAASPGLAGTLPLPTASAAATAFFDASQRSWFGETFLADAPLLDAPAQAAVDGLQALSVAGMHRLDDLLVARIGAAVGHRNLTLAIVAVSLALVLYLFHCFFLVMKGGLAEVERHLLAMTDGDLTTCPRPWGSDEAAGLMQSLERMQRSLRGIVTEVRTASDGLVNASDEIASASSDLSLRSEQAAASLEASASAMAQISSAALQSADATRTVSELASDNASVAEAGGRTIHQVIASMQEVQSSSARIAEIIGVIDGIAFQTNILALNAAVEAARAGEQGRGFAVVASEVRALAQRSATAAREVRTLIASSAERVEAGTRVVGTAGARMGELVVNAERMKSLMNEVFASSGEQSAGVRQVGGSIRTLDQQTQQNAALVEQTAAAAASLHDQAISLAERVARFRLPESLAAE